LPYAHAYRYPLEYDHGGSEGQNKSLNLSINEAKLCQSEGKNKVANMKRNRRKGKEFSGKQEKEGKAKKFGGKTTETKRKSIIGGIGSLMSVVRKS
jgi:hypothetical protein